VSRADRIALLVAVVLAAGAYAGSLGHDFTYDDVHIIKESALLHSLGNWRAILRATWWEDAMYRPFTALTFAVDWALSGGDPRWFHAVNVLIHAGVVVLVFLLARSLLPLFPAAAAAALFAVHPVHVEAVANVVGRAELLATLFALGAVLLYRADGELAARGDVSWRRWLASWGTLAALWLALASKESAFAAPGLLLLADWVDARRAGVRWGVAVRRHWMLAAASVALTGEWLWIWLSTVGAIGGGAGEAPGLEGAGLGTRLLVMAPVVLQYVRLLFFPARLSADYSPDFLPVAEHLNLAGVLGFALVGAAVAAGWAARARAWPVTVALVWMGGTLLIVSNLLVPTEVLLAERTLYLPSVGAALLVGYGLGAIAQRRLNVAAALGGLLVALGVWRTATRVPVWRDDSTLLHQLVRDAPGSFRADWVLGGFYFIGGDSASGEALYRRALRTNPLHAQLWDDLGVQMETQRRWEDAAPAFAAAFRISRRRAESAARAIVNYLRAGMVDSAAVLAHEARALHVEDYRVQIALGDLALARGRPLEAMTWRRRVARRFPDVWWYWWLTADAGAQAGYCPEAEHAVGELERLGADPERRAEVVRRAKKVGCRL
jgi:tetratricopeptide (TPR) repeat protein